MFVTKKFLRAGDDDLIHIRSRAVEAKQHSPHIVHRWVRELVVDQFSSFVPHAISSNDIISHKIVSDPMAIISIFFNELYFFASK